MITKQRDGVAPGDVIEVTGRRVGDRGRTGEILDLLGTPDHPYYVVRWEDGHETILYPGEGTRIRKGAPRPAAERDLAAAAEHLTAELREAGIEFEVLPHPRTVTATGEARVLGVLPQVVAKTLIARDDAGRCVRAVVPASCRIDVEKLAGAVGAKTVSLLSEEELVSAYPQFELGAVPPFGGPGGDRVVVDRRVAESDHVVLEAGVHDVSLRLRTDDLLTVAGGELADIASG